MQFSHLRETTAGKGKGTSVWRGQWNKTGNAQTWLPTCTPGKNRAMEVMWEEGKELNLPATQS